MRASPAALLAIAVAGGGLALSLAGCATTAPAASHAVITRPGAAHQVRQPARPHSQAPGTPAGTSAMPAARVAAQAAASGTQATAPASASPQQTGSSASGRPVTLATGLYTDAPEGLPHYVLAVTPTAGGSVKGSANFVYQDGRIAFVGQYSGTVSGNGKVTVRFADGKILAGDYRTETLTLADCASVLSMARNPGGCTFSYHGNVP